MGGRPPHRKRIPHIIAAVCVFLLLGAIVNVAVAWGCAHGARLPKGLAGDALSLDEASKLWQVYGWGPAPQTRVPKGWRERRAFTSTTWVGTSLMSGNTGQFIGFAVAPTVSDALIVESGAPLRSLRHMASDVVSTMPTTPAPPSHAPPVSNQFKWLSQTRPIWPGFAINTLFYAGILWLLLAAPFALRRWRGGRRIKRGLCPACAYPVGESDVCTECGRPVTGWRARVARMT